MKIYNSLSKSVEEFKPIKKGEVGMYTCGPTVYDYQHIGNFRTMVLSDLVHRVLEYNGYKVKTVRNITDIDDKIIGNASEKGVPIEKYSEEYTKIFFADAEKLNILPSDVTTYATEYVAKMVHYVEDLVKKGIAYVEPDGSVYFAISKFPGYGKLSGIKKSDLKTGTRVLSDEYDKENVQDFALWKATKSGEIQSYDSPWGKGRPGWHIECSVMSQENLGETFDLHLGGRDLLFPHHENEIAQSEAKTGEKFVNFWMHGEFLNVDDGKMSKSLKNFYTVKDIEEKGFEPLALRYFYFTAHYRKVLNFTWDGLESAQNSLSKLRSKIGALQQSLQDQVLQTQYKQRFLEAVNDDLNMPKALAVVWKAAEAGDLASVLEFDKVLGLRLNQAEQAQQVPQEVVVLSDERERYRLEGKFEEADKVREKIEKMGYTVSDTAEGSRIGKK